MDDKTFQRKINHVAKLMKELNDENRRRYDTGMVIDADCGAVMAMRKEPEDRCNFMSASERQEYIEFSSRINTGWSSVVW